MNKALFLILIFCAALPLVAQENYSARVVDAETGEPMPYATIYISSAKGTLSNNDGYFSIEAMPGDSLRISYVGYIVQKLAATRLPRTIRMKPLATDMKEVEILSSYAILERVARELNESYKKGKEHCGTFFYRTSETMNGKVDMTEAFLNSETAVHLHNLSVLNGHRMQLYDSDSVPFLDDLNMHHILELGPMVQKNPFWKATIDPPFNGQNYKRNYVCQSIMKLYEGDVFLYRIQLNGKKNNMDGVLYVDGTTWQVRRFEGHLPNIQLLTKAEKQTRLQEVEINFTAEYTYRNGYAEVANAHYDMKGHNVHSRGVLLNVEDMDLDLPEKGKKMGDNMAATIEEAGAGSLMWAGSGIIQRTQEEEQIALQHARRTGGMEIVASIQPAQKDEHHDSGPADTLQAIPQELVYVHMDNTSYFLGDTLYYKAYVVRSDRGTPSNISQILYTELLNQDGYLVERQMLRLADGQAAGSFCLPDTLYAGFYELRAYTRWQLNWGRTEHPHSKTAEKWFLRPDMAKDYFRDYDKLYSRVFPLYDRPKEAGKYSRDMTLRPLRRYHKIKTEKPRAEVTVYPEGGAWTEGVPQRLAFEANSPEGEHLSGTLIVYDSRHKAIAQAPTEHRGRGTVELTAEAGEVYTAEFHWGDKHVEKVQLPSSEKSGAAMKVEQEEGRLNISIARSGNVPAELTLTARTNGIARFSQKVQGVQKVQEVQGSNCQLSIVNCQLSIDLRSSLPTGVAQLTLHDGKGKVWADRLCFVHHDDLRPGNVRVTGLPEQGEPLEKVTMMLEAPAQTTLSVAVRDKALSDPLYDNGTLLTEMLLASQLKGFVEDPGWYFEADDPEHRRALDLLLMVQGWRRYRWQETPDSFQMEEPFEKYPVIRGDVSQYSPLEQEDYFYTASVDDPGINLYEEIHSRGNTGPILMEVLSVTDETSHRFLENLELGAARFGYISIKNDPIDYQSVSALKDELTVHAEFDVPAHVSNRNASLDVPTRKGVFALQAPTTNGYHYMFLSAQKPDKGPVIRRDANQYPDYSLRLRPFYPRFVKPYSYYQKHIGEFKDNVTDRQDEGELKEILVGAQRGGLRSFDPNHPVMVLDAYEAFNEVVDAGLSPAWYAGALSFSLNAARCYIGDMGVGRTYLLERRWDGKNMSSFIPYHEQQRYNHLEYLKRVVIYTDYSPRLEGDKRYQASDQPSVTINIERIPQEERRSTYRDRFYGMPGLSVCEEFYQPDYSKRKLPKDFKDYRRTLYWNPALRLDESGRATVSFYNNSRPGQFSVSAQGITKNGLILTSEE